MFTHPPNSHTLVINSPGNFKSARALIGENERPRYHSHACILFFCLLVHVIRLVTSEEKEQVCVIILGFQNFKNPYLSNRASKFRSVFTIGFLATRSFKLDPTWICFDEFFFMPTLVLYGATLVLHCATLVLYCATFFQNQFLELYEPNSSVLAT